jgi:hypothetical protein
MLAAAGLALSLHNYLGLRSDSLRLTETRNCLELYLNQVIICDMSQNLGEEREERGVGLGK